MSEVIRKFLKRCEEALDWVKTKFLKPQISNSLSEKKRDVVQRISPPPVMNLMLRSVLNQKPLNQLIKVPKRPIYSSSVDRELYSIMNQKPQDEFQRRFKPSSNMNKLPQYKRSVKRPAMKNRQYSRFFRFIQNVPIIMRYLQIFFEQNGLIAFVEKLVGEELEELKELEEAPFC
ncbi:hypothetical protein C1646_743063 [Rhizophagus diaphanus]|nr:hypothetical protein C1646_743063 [Rhizophagus diaphanus] [Rhizophagus sp. MUCL 43196]